MEYNSTVLFVSDIERSKQFYGNLFNLKIKQDFGTSLTFDGGLSIWQPNEEHIIARKLKNEKGIHRMELYFEEAKIDSFYAILKENKVEFFHELVTEPWGQKTIRFFDPDNHLVEVGEPVPVFIKRMYNEGLKIEEINFKTGVPLNEIQHMLSE